MAATMARAKAKRATGTTSPRAEPAPAAKAPVSATISKGDIVWIDYEGWILNPIGTRTVFDTTRAEVAKKEDRFDEKKVYA